VRHFENTKFDNASWCSVGTCSMVRDAELAATLRPLAGEPEALGIMSLQFKNYLLDFWSEAPHKANPHEYEAEAKPIGATNRDQVMAVVQALEASGTSRTPAEPISEVARAFLLSSPKQSALLPPSPTPITSNLPNSTQNAELDAEACYSMENAANRVEVSIRRYSNSSECDVVVCFRDREMVVRLPDYVRALKWAEMESRSYRLPARFAENAPLDS